MTGQKNNIKVKTDCFAYNSMKNKCEALIELFCAKENCKFYKTQQQLEEQKMKIAKRAN